MPFGAVPENESVYGPELLLGALTGEVLMRSDGEVRGNTPTPPLTGAFFVWVGFPVVVVSEGVPPSRTTAVAGNLRAALSAPEVPIVFSTGRLEAGRGTTAASDNPVGSDAAGLARAEAYVLVQRAWHEGPTVAVELDGVRFELRLEMRAVGDGTYRPVVSS